MWEPSQKRVEASQMFAFQSYVEKSFDKKFSNYSQFHQWSVEHSEEFWTTLIDYYGMIYEGELIPACSDHSFNSYGWYPNVKLNFAENLLLKGKDNRVALNFLHESGLKKELSYKELRSSVSKLQQALAQDIGKGDVLACYMPNISETVISMLAVSSLGGIFTSTSADFGIEGVVDRFGQSGPKVLVTVAGYEYSGKYFDMCDKLVEIIKKVPSIEKVIVVDFLGKKPDIEKIPNSILWDDLLSSLKAKEIEFKKVPFHSPIYIMYSSGTTGKPKCIVHSAGGTLLQHVKELGPHSNFDETKNILYFTTCGWMMWNWLVSALYFGGTVSLYEGSPGYPSLKSFMELVDREAVNLFGTSPKFLKALEDSLGEGESLPSFDSMELLLSTGAPLLPEQFDFIYNKIKSDLQVASICGGTDIIGCFMLGNPMAPVKRGEIQSLGLGMDVACFNESGRAVINREGELVCRRSFPSRPIYFLNDEGNRKINSAYFEKYPSVWHHGDFISITDDRSVKVFGRSDATLNPGGVRIGTAEIYRQTEMLNYIEDSLCVGKQNDGDVDVVLFVMMKEGEKLTDDRIMEIKSKIKKNTTPRHVPREIYQIQDIPYTRSGKKMELAITRVINNRPLTNIEAVKNPECLKEYEQFI